MDAVSLLRDQFKEAHNLMEATMQDVTPDQAHWAPPGIANPLGATYAHVVTGEDAMLNGLIRQQAPLFAGEWGPKTGLSAPPPSPDQGSWDQWARTVQVDVPAIREYARAVYDATDQYLTSISVDELNRGIDLSAFQLGKQTVGWFLSNIVLSHPGHHCGEISCLKGLQGVKGYPF